MAYGWQTTLATPLTRKGFLALRNFRRKTILQNDVLTLDVVEVTQSSSHGRKINRFLFLVGSMPKNANSGNGIGIALGPSNLRPCRSRATDKRDNTGGYDGW